MILRLINRALRPVGLVVVPIAEPVYVAVNIQMDGRKVGEALRATKPVLDQCPT